MRVTLLAVALAAVASVAAAAPKAPPGPPPPAASDWRTPDPNNVLVIDTNRGRIVVEMVPEAAPLFTARMRELAHQHFFDGQTFFRVIDGFMDQTGDPKNDGTGGSTLPDVPAEFTFRRGPDVPFAKLADRAGTEVGLIGPLPVLSQNIMLAAMTNDGKVEAHALYCPGVAGAARDDKPDSANSQFFLMRATYPKLETRYTAWGRVIAGQDVVNSIIVGEPVPPPQDRMERVRLLADLPPDSRPKIRVVRSDSPWLKAEVARIQADEGAGFSACDVNIPAEVK